MKLKETLLLMDRAETSEDILFLTTEFLRSCNLGARDMVEAVKQLNAAGSARREELWKQREQEIIDESNQAIENYKKETRQKLDESLSYLAEKFGVKGR